MAIPAGRLRERVTLQQKNLVDNGRGGRARPQDGPEWIDVPGVPVLKAEIIPLRGDEALQNAVLRSLQMYRVTIRARDGVATAHRLMWGQAALDIISAAPSPDRRDLVMICQSGSAAQ